MRTVMSITAAKSTMKFGLDFGFDLSEMIDYVVEPPTGAYRATEIN